MQKHPGENVVARVIFTKEAKSLIPVFGHLEDALRAEGALVSICDGKELPERIQDFLEQGEQDLIVVISSGADGSAYKVFLDYLNQVFSSEIQRIHVIVIRKPPAAVAPAEGVSIVLDPNTASEVILSTLLGIKGPVKPAERPPEEEETISPPEEKKPEPKLPAETEAKPRTEEKPKVEKQIIHRGGIVIATPGIWCVVGLTQKEITFLMRKFSSSKTPAKVFDGGLLVGGADSPVVVRISNLIEALSEPGKVILVLDSEKPYEARALEALSAVLVVVRDAFSAGALIERLRKAYPSVEIKVAANPAEEVYKFVVERSFQYIGREWVL